MKIKFISLFLIHSLFGSLSLFTQYYLVGQDPARVKWRQLKTEHFQIIYPKDYEKKTPHIAKLLESAYQLHNQTQKHKSSLIPVILHTQTTKANGFVAWVPKRMELYTIPPQNIHSEEWIELLTMHEVRHVTQMQKINKGIIKFISLLFGEQIVGSILILYPPVWFLEGDAVLAETVFSKAGRGRLPSFEMKLRSQLLQNKIFSYSKAYLGSYKDFVPNHYVLGYHITAMGTRKYGTKLWNYSPNFSSFGKMIYPFDKQIADITGNRKTTLYKNIMKKLDSLWWRQDKMILPTHSPPLNNPSSIYTNYTEPKLTEEGYIIAKKSGFTDITHYVRIDKNKNEQKIKELGITYDEPFSFKKKRIVWAEPVNSIRWEHKNTSILKMLNLSTKKTLRFRYNQNLFNPSLSNDLTKIIAVESTPNNEYSLILINAQTGKIIKKIPNPTNLFFINPRWSNDDRSIYTLTLNTKGKQILKINAENGIIEQLTESTYAQIENLTPTRNYLFFTASFSGIDNIYAYNFDKKQIFKITNSRFGANNAFVSPDEKTLLYNDYSYKGYNIKRQELDPNHWEPLSQVENTSIKLYEHTLTKKKETIDHPVDTIIYETKNYSKALHLFNFHSWAPFILNINDIATTVPQTPDIGLTLLSQNKLSTATTNASLGYLSHLDAYNLNLIFSYKALYPVFNLNINTYFKNTIPHNRFLDSLDLPTSYHLTMQLPLQRWYGSYNANLTPKIGYELQNRRSNNSSILSTSINLGIYRKRAYREMRPKFGIISNINYSNYLSIPLSIFNVENIYFLPGLFQNHSFKIYNGIQYKKYHSGLYFLDKIRIARGTKSFVNDYLRTIQFDYQLPISYPDFNITSLTYIKRISGGVFYDQTLASFSPLKESQTSQSIGMEITLDLHVFNILFPFSIGWRQGYSITQKENFGNLLFRISF